MSQSMSQNISRAVLLIGCLYAALWLGGCAERRTPAPKSEPAPTVSPTPAAIPAPPTEPTAPLVDSTQQQGVPALSESEKIELLIKSFTESNAIFIRNDTEYPGAEAASHLRRKWKFAGNQIKTAKDFIEQLASKSSETGKPYQIKSPDGTLVESRAWLLQRLQVIEGAPAPVR